MSDTGEASSRLSAALADRYRLEREIGQGGMATVFLAQDLKHGRWVAIKLLRAEVAAALGAGRFLREIATTAALRHPHILPLHDSGEADGLLFYVMPFVEGESLRQRLERERQLPVDDAVQIASEVADALGYAHSRGVIHRDVKPENILMEAGHAVVADFGVARAVGTDGGTQITREGFAVGTPQYMSPEQASASPDLDGRSDLYALGCVLYEMLAGRPPFEGEEWARILYQHSVTEPRRIAELRPGIPEGVQQVLARLLAKSPADRPATGSQVVEALRGGAMRTPAPTPAPPRSIAVLAFANMSADPNNEFLADGIAEEIINALTRLPDLRVAARTSAFSFKGRDEDLRTVGERLNVTTVLEGSVRRAGSRLRVTAQLINVADGFHLWSERYDRELHDVFAIQDEIAAAIVARLKLAFGTGPGLVQPGTDNVEAYQLCLRGRALLYRRGLNIMRSRECFEQALALDPGYALAYSGLADAHLYAGMWGLERAAVTMPRGRSAARRALELDPNLAEAHYALACVAFFFDADAEVFGAEFARAVELKPSYTQGRCGWALYDLSGYREDHAAAVAESARAVREDPYSAYAAAIHAMLLYRAGRVEEAVAEARRSTDLDPDSVAAWWHRQAILGWSGDHEGAVRAGETALALYPGFTWAESALAAEYGRVGDVATAAAIYQRMLARAEAGYVQDSWLAIAAAACGRVEEGFEHLRHAARDRDGVLFSLVKVWDDVAPLRRMPGYQDLIRQLHWDYPPTPDTGDPA